MENQVESNFEKRINSFFENLKKEKKYNSFQLEEY